jgi:YihY family inner membrane protein
MASETKPSDGALEKVTSSEAVRTVEKNVKPVQMFAQKFSNDWAMSFAGLIAYSLLTAMLPIAIALLGILGLVLGGNPGLQQQITTQAMHAFPTAISNQNTLQLASSQLSKYGGFLVVIAILLAIFGGSRLFITLESCLDIIYRLRPRPFLRQNLMAFAMLILFIILIPIMVFASALPVFVISFIQKTPLAGIPGAGLLFSVGGFLGGLIVAFILFEAIYFVVPNQSISWRNSWRGALIAAVALDIFLLIIFPFYVSHFMAGYAGTVGFAVVLLVFFYYFAVILMLGAEVNAFFFEHIRPLPNDLATFVSTMAGKLNRDQPEAESESHVDTNPIDRADKSRVAEVQHQEEEIKQSNQQKQQNLAARLLVRDKGKAKAKKEQSSSRLPTIVGVVAGSALATVIEWTRLRQQGK